jgi:hypothetical protein
VISHSRSAVVVLTVKDKLVAYPRSFHVHFRLNTNSICFSCIFLSIYMEENFTCEADRRSASQEIVVFYGT